MYTSSMYLHVLCMGLAFLLKLISELHGRFLLFALFPKRILFDTLSSYVSLLSISTARLYDTAEIFIYLDLHNKSEDRKSVV